MTHLTQDEAYLKKLQLYIIFVERPVSSLILSTGLYFLLENGGKTMADVMLSKHTLEKPLFQNPMNQMAFYELDIPKQLRQKFDYAVPQHIDYQEAQKQVYAYIGAGAVAAAGGVVSICMENWMPVTVAVLLAGIMAAVLYTNSQKRKQNVERLIQEYLDAIEESMMDWVGSIEEYYDKQTAILERKVLENNG